MFYSFDLDCASWYGLSSTGTLLLWISKKPNNSANQVHLCFEKQCDSDIDRFRKEH